MNNDYKSTFKLLIKEFHDRKFSVDCFERELKLEENPKKIIVLYGSRRSGKTFCLYNQINLLIKKGIKKEQIVYLNFEDDRLIDLKVKDLNEIIEAYYELYPANTENILYFFFDEIQLITGWEYFLRRIFDTLNAKIFITGLSTKLLSKEIATSLRGRCLSYAMYPLSFREFLIFKGIKLEKDFKYTKQRFKVKKLLNEYVEYGMFPEVALTSDEEIKRKILKEYYDSLVYKDLMDRYDLKNTDLLKELLRFLFTNFTKEFSVNRYYKTVKQSLSISRETIIQYLNFIHETFYIFLLPVFSYSLKKQRVNPKKVIVLDNGLRNKICFRTSDDTGKLVENIVGVTLIRKYEEVFFWKDNAEVDFIIKDTSGFLHAFNVSYTNSIPEREFNSLIEFKKQHKNVRSLNIISHEIEEKRKNINIRPFLNWLLES
ncbi:MAG: ATP-binding protein [Candidatus Melainabacteria bacterium]|nr:ATP-binding protein [Candidatus Melainabacteria bacterium]